MARIAAGTTNLKGRRQPPKAKTLPVGKPAVHEDHLHSFIDPEGRWSMVAEAAYYRSESRGFEPGHEVEDWLAAELEIDRELSGASH